jgi:hypothetical protein
MFLACKENQATKVKVTEATRMRGYSDLESKETTNMTGRRRGLPQFKVMKMRTEEELVACGVSGTQGSDSCGIRIQRSVITKDTTIILLSPPSCRLSFSCGKGGGDSTQTQPECRGGMALFLLLLPLLLLLLFLLFLLLHCHQAI